MIISNLFWIGLFGGVVKLAYVVPYLYEIFKKGVRPNRASWLIWFILGLIAFFSQQAKGASNSLFMTGAEIIATFCIFTTSIFKGEGGFNSFDIFALLGAGAGLLLWAVFHQPLLALLAVVFIEVMALLPTLKKSYLDPARESKLAFIFSGTGSLITCFAVGQWNFALLLYPVYLVFANYLIVLVSFLGQKKNYDVASRI